MNDSPENKNEIYETPEEKVKRCRERLKNDPNNQDAMLWFEYGKALWAMGQRAEAENAFLQSVSLNPKSPAKIALEMCRDISSFFNPDLLNP